MKEKVKTVAVVAGLLLVFAFARACLSKWTWGLSWVEILIVVPIAVIIGLVAGHHLMKRDESGKKEIQHPNRHVR